MWPTCRAQGTTSSDETLAKMLDAPMPIYPAPAICYHRHGGELPIMVRLPTNFAMVVLRRFDRLLPYGTVGYLRNSMPAHNLVPQGFKCVLLGTSQNHPRLTFCVRDSTRDQSFYGTW